MATIIDALIVTLGLDTSGFSKGRKDYQDERKRIDDTEERSDRQAADRHKKGIERWGQLRSAVLEYFAVFTAGRDIVEFARNTLTADAATGRLAQNLGVSTQALSVWQSVVKQAGGSAEDANSSIQALVTTTQAMMVAGDYSRANYLQALGISPADLQNPLATLDKLHTAFAGMTGARAQFMGSAIGLNQNAINALRDPNYRQNEASALAAGVPTDADAKRAQAAQQQLVLLGQASAQMGRVLLEIAAPGITALAHGLMDMAEWAQQHPAVIIGAFVGIAAALGIATVAAGILAITLAPEAAVMAGVAAAAVGLGAAIGYVVDQFHRLAHIKGVDWKTGNVIFGDDKDSAPAKPGPITPPNIRGNVHDYFRATGFSESSTQGILAGITAESGGNYRATNAQSGAYGIGQWLGDRQRQFAKLFGHDIHQSSLQEQLQYIVYELRHGERSAGAAIAGARTGGAALSAYVNRYMRPGAGAAGDIRRGLASNGGLQVGQMTVYSSAPDAKGLMADVRKSAQRYANVQNANPALS